jgi:hypothetical protein
MDSSTSIVYSLFTVVDGEREVRAIVDIQWALNQNGGGGGDGGGGGGGCGGGGDDSDDDSDDDYNDGGGGGGCSSESDYYNDDYNDDDSDSTSTSYGGFDDEFADDDGGAVAVALPGRKKGDALDQHDQDKCVLTLAYNACAIKFMAQQRLATILRGKNAKPPLPVI